MFSSNNGVRLDDEVRKHFGAERASPAYSLHAPVAVFRGVVMTFDGIIREVHDPGLPDARPRVQGQLDVPELDALVLAQDAGLAHEVKLLDRETPPRYLFSRLRLHESLPALHRR